MKSKPSNSKVVWLLILCFSLIISSGLLLEYLANSSRDSKKQDQTTQIVKPVPKVEANTLNNNDSKNLSLETKEYSFGEYIIAIFTFDTAVIKTLSFLDIVLGLFAILVIADIVKDIVITLFGKND